MHNSQKRSLDDCEQNWKAYRLDAGKALNQRLEPSFKKPTKSKHVNFIYTRQVAYDKKKNKYVPTEIKQCVEMMCELEYDSVCEKVWKYYQKENGFRQDVYDLHLIIGPNGPIVVNTLQLDNKRDLFVMFERKVKVNFGTRGTEIRILTKFIKRINSLVNTILAWMGDWSRDSELLNKLEELLLNGYKQQEMLAVLEKEFSCYTWSRSTLQRRLKYFQLRRNDSTIDPEVLLKVVKTEVEGPGGLLGYRGLHKKIRNEHRLRVKRSDVYLAMNLTCPEKLVERRLVNKRKRFQKRQFKSKGSNWVWSIDGHDKLSGKNKSEFPFGIHGGIDSFSRKILWLKVWPSNCSPALPAKLFYDAIVQHAFVPCKTRSDRGNENVTVAAMQNFLTNAENGESNHIFGSSITNQVIEQWWRGFRERHGEYFKSIMHELLIGGYYDESNTTCRVLLAYVYIPLIQKELDSFSLNHNTHRIRKQDIYRPCGIPNYLYEFPKKNGGVQCGIIPDVRSMLYLKREVSELEKFQFVDEKTDQMLSEELDTTFGSKPTLTLAKTCYIHLLKKFLSTELKFSFS